MKLPATEFELICKQAVKRLFDICKTEKDIKLFANASMEIGELFELAKLGAAALEVMDNVGYEDYSKPCNEHVYYNSRSCQPCNWKTFCKLRKELDK